MGGTYSQPKEIQSKHYSEFKKGLPSQTGRVIAITGCTTGTGYVAAKCCGELGAHVIMLNRKSQRADEALDSLRSSVPNGQFTQIECDMMSFDSVRKAAMEVKTKFSLGIDCLSCNAGIMAMPDKATVDGYDQQIQTNHLSHFLLVSELMPLLEKAAERTGDSRIVNHSSGARHYPSKVIIDKFFEKNGGNLGGDSDGVFMNGPRWQRYNQTKLANIVFTYGLADKLAAANSKVKALVCTPGLAATNLQVTTNATGGMGGTLTHVLFGLVGQSAEDGAMPLIQCMVGAGVENKELYEPSNYTCYGTAQKYPLEIEYDKEEEKKKLWDLSVKACGQGILGYNQF